MQISFKTSAWQEYLEWQGKDKQILRKINLLIKDIERNGVSEGLGKPEPLKHDFSGYWSRRITDAHRLVYTVKSDVLIILACKGHYD